MKFLDLDDGAGWQLLQVCVGRHINLSRRNLLLLNLNTHCGGQALSCLSFNLDLS